jgi:DNA-binding LytR/AlgR family response regulator
VKLDAIREVAPLVGGHGEIELLSGETLPVSRRRFQLLLDRLGGGERR